jgi:GntR family transcriptional regulator
MAARYQKIADELRGTVLEGELGPGAKLPTEQELMRKHGVSRNTIRMAIAALANEGLIATQPGRGGGAFVRGRMLLTYYAAREDSPGSEHTAEFDKIIRAQGAAPREAFSLGVEEATAPVAERLHVPEGSVVILRRLVRWADSEPVSVQDSYYPGDIAKGTKIEEPRSVPEGILKELARLGHEQTGFSDELTAGMPSPEEAGVLEVGRGIPVITHWRTSYSADRPIRVTRTLFAADRNRLVYEVGDTRASDNGMPAGPSAEERPAAVLYGGDVTLQCHGDKAVCVRLRRPEFGYDA